MSKKSGKKKTSPAVYSAAGLVRFFEESEAKVVLKPPVIIGLAILFSAIVIILSKVLPPPV